MEDRIKNLCERKKEKCLDITTEKDFTLEDKKPKTLSERSSVTLDIINKKEKEIYKVQVDGCLLTKSDRKRCDWSLYFENKLVFIELKSNYLYFETENIELKYDKKIGDLLEKFKDTEKYFCPAPEIEVKYFLVCDPLKTKAQIIQKMLDRENFAVIYGGHMRVAKISIEDF